MLDLASDPEVAVRLKVAANVACPSAVLAQLSADPHPGVRQNAALERTPNETHGAEDGACHADERIVRGHRGLSGHRLLVLHAMSANPEGTGGVPCAEWLQVVLAAGVRMAEMTV